MTRPPAFELASSSALTRHPGTRAEVWTNTASLWPGIGKHDLAPAGIAEVVLRAFELDSQAGATPAKGMRQALKRAQEQG